MTVEIKCWVLRPKRGEEVSLCGREDDCFEQLVPNRKGQWPATLVVEVPDGDAA